MSALGPSMRSVCCLAVICAVAIPAYSSAWAQKTAQISCGDVPLTLDLPGFRLECSEIDPTPAEQPKAREEMTRLGMPLGFIETMFPADAKTYNLLYGEPQKT